MKLKYLLPILGPIFAFETKWVLHSMIAQIPWAVLISYIWIEIFF